MENTIIIFGDMGIEKQKLSQKQKTYFKKTIDIDKIVVFNNVSLGKKGFKYLTGYKDAKQITSLCMFLPKVGTYRGDFDETNYMSFLIKDDELLEKYN